MVSVAGVSLVVFGVRGFRFGASPLRSVIIFETSMNAASASRPLTVSKYSQTRSNPLRLTFVAIHTLLFELKIVPVVVPHRRRLQVIPLRLSADRALRQFRICR